MRDEDHPGAADQDATNLADSRIALDQDHPLYDVVARLETAMDSLAAEAEATAVQLADREEALAKAQDLADTLKGKLREAEQVLSREQDNSARQQSSQTAELKERLSKLEKENLGLHEQIASHSLAEPGSGAELRGQLASLQAEKKTQAEALDRLGAENRQLEQRLADLESQQDSLRAALDSAVSELDAIIGAATPATEQAHG